MIMVVFMSLMVWTDPLKLKASQILSNIENGLRTDHLVSIYVENLSGTRLKKD